MSQIQISTAELQYPGWLKELLTHPVKGLENYAEMIRLLTETKGAIKVYCEGAAIEGAQTAAVKAKRSSVSHLTAAWSHQSTSHYSMRSGMRQDTTSRPITRVKTQSENWPPSF